MAWKLLIIEDDVDLIELLKFRLKGAGYDVVSATSADEGIKKARGEKPQLVLLDNVMPGRKGSDVVKELKKDEATKDIPIVMISGKGEIYYSGKKQQFEWQPHHPLVKERGSLPEGKSAETLSKIYGVDDYIAKPFDGNLVVEVIRDVLKKKKGDFSGAEGADGTDIVFD